MSYTPSFNNNANNYSNGYNQRPNYYQPQPQGRRYPQAPPPSLLPQPAFPAFPQTQVPPAYSTPHYLPPTFQPFAQIQGTAAYHPPRYPPRQPYQQTQEAPHYRPQPYHKSAHATTPQFYPQTQHSVPYRSQGQQKPAHPTGPPKKFPPRRNMNNNNNNNNNFNNKTKKEKKHQRVENLPLFSSYYPHTRPKLERKPRFAMVTSSNPPSISPQDPDQQYVDEYPPENESIENENKENTTQISPTDSEHDESEQEQEQEDGDEDNVDELELNDEKQTETQQTSESNQDENEEKKKVKKPLYAVMIESPNFPSVYPDPYWIGKSSPYSILTMVAPKTRRGMEGDDYDFYQTENGAILCVLKFFWMGGPISFQTLPTKESFKVHKNRAALMAIESLNLRSQWDLVIAEMKEKPHIDWKKLGEENLGEGNVYTPKFESVTERSQDISEQFQNSKGLKLLQSMGWEQGKGLGKNEKGVQNMDDIISTGLPPFQTRGLGAQMDKKEIFSNEIRKVLKDFKESEKTTISFSQSLDSTQRAVIHEIARQLALKSRSQGKSNNRFITVVKL